MSTNGLGGPNPIPPHVLSLQEAEDRIHPYKELLNQCIRYGWTAYMTDYASKHHLLSARARAAIVFDEIRHRAEVVFGAMSDVRFVPHPNSFMLYIGDDIALRFKKLKNNNLCSNINTRQQLLFQAQMRLPGILAGTLVHAGYLLDELQQEIIRTMVVCQFENRVLWTIRLTDEAGEAIIITPPAPTVEPPAAHWEFTGEKAIEADERKEESGEADAHNQK
ncbi:MAG: hypothetical protein WA294_09335 [Acidobacteriaceae bacterium]